MFFDCNAYIPNDVEQQSFKLPLIQFVHLHCQVSHWVNAICDRSMQELHDLSKPFKYVVSCVIVQKNGAGFHIGHSAYWDISNDNVCQVRHFLWEYYHPEEGANRI